MESLSSHEDDIFALHPEAYDNADEIREEVRKKVSSSSQIVFHNVWTEEREAFFHRYFSGLFEDEDIEYEDQRLDRLFQKLRDNFQGTVDDFITAFRDEASEMGFDDDVIDQFLETHMKEIESFCEEQTARESNETKRERKNSSRQKQKHHRQKGSDYIWEDASSGFSNDHNQHFEYAASYTFQKDKKPLDEEYYSLLSSIWEQMILYMPYFFTPDFVWYRFLLQAEQRGIPRGAIVAFYVSQRNFIQKMFPWIFEAEKRA